MACMRTLLDGGLQDAKGKVYQMKCTDGTGQLVIHAVYPGICVVYNTLEAAACQWEEPLGEYMLEINHCREGREGCHLPSGACLYLGEGDLSIHAMDNCAFQMSFPLRHYSGVSVIVDLQKVVEHPPEILLQSGIDLYRLKEKFCAAGGCFVMRARDEIEHIFSAFYTVQDDLKEACLKLKVQELLLFLWQIDVASEKQREQYTAPHVETVKKIHHSLTSDLQARHTIDELSKAFLINTATLKATFKGIYGQPIGSYMKAYRMRHAAMLLRQTRKSIAEIANDVGYHNQSKFAAAFREIMQISPAEYRRENTGTGAVSIASTAEK